MSGAVHDEFAAELAALEKELSLERLAAAAREAREKEALGKVKELHERFLGSREHVSSLEKDLASERTRREEAEQDISVLRKEVVQKNDAIERYQKEMKALEFDRSRQRSSDSSRHSLDRWRLHTSARKQLRDVSQRAQEVASIVAATLASTFGVLLELESEVRLISAEEEKRRDEMQQMSNDLRSTANAGLRSSAMVSVFAASAGAP